jgi:hypothetical protein
MLYRVMISVSIITTCMPALRHVLTNLSTGLAGTHIPAQLGRSASQKYGYGSRSQSKNMLSSKGNYNNSRNRSQSRGRDRNYENFSRAIDRSVTVTNVSITSQRSAKGGWRQDRRSGQRSSDGTKRLNIKDGTVVKTTDITVDIEEEGEEYWARRIL